MHDAPPDLVTFAVGDIHGELEKLRVVITACRAYASGRPAKFVMLGDFVNRGPDSRGVIEYLMNWDGPERLVCLKGNHEDMLITALEHPNWSAALWLDQGGRATLESFGVAHLHQLPHGVATWLAGLPLFHDDGERFFVHAGIDPTIPLDQQTDAVMMYSRKDYPGDIDVGRYVVHGHTTTDGVPVPGRNRINLDTGACSGGSLSAAAFVAGRKLPVAVISDDLVVELDAAWSSPAP